jgi:hypothetical protein
MLRHSDKLRLTGTERKTFAAFTGTKAAPTTVAEHDTALELAAQAWEVGDSAEEQLAAMLARDMKVEPDASPPEASGTT